jgi:D-aspartate ligase
MALRPRSSADPIDTSTPILIFGLGPGELHHGALGIARSAGRLGIPVHRLALERSTPITLSRYNRGWTQVPPQASAEQVLELMHETARRIGTSILIPVDDAGSVFVDEHVDALGDFLFAHQPEGLARRLSSKRGMYELCQKHGVDTPHSAFPNCEREAVELCEQWEFPLVLKCINAGDAPPGSPRVAIANDRDQALSSYRAMEVLDTANVMFQDYIPGTPETVWMFNGYFSDSSTCKVGFTGKKIRQSPPYTGATTLGVCANNELVGETTLRFMKEIGYRGIIDMGYRFDERDSRYKLLDVNPRIGATFRLFVGANGMDVLRAMYLDLTGQDVPDTELQSGRRWLVEHMDLASSVVYRRRGDLTLAGWLRSFGGVRETAWFALDDPLPFLALWLKLLVKRGPARLRQWARGAQSATSAS